MVKIPNPFKRDQTVPPTFVHKPLLEVEAQSQKAITTGATTWGNLFGLTPSYDLMNTNWGAATGYLVVPSIKAATDLLVDSVAGLTWVIREQTGSPDDPGEILSSSEENFPKEPFAMAVREFRRENGRDLMGLIEFCRVVYGETYIVRELNQWGFFARELDWLNPLGAEPIIEQGIITGFRYGWNNSYIVYKPIEIAYDHDNYPLDDNRGYGLVRSVLDKANITRNIDRYLRAFFRNDAMPGLVAMPDSETVAWSNLDYQNAKDLFRSQFRGVDNAFRVFLSQQRLELQALTPPDVGNQYSIEEQLTNAIYEVFRVPRAMLGNTSSTPYKDGDETTKRFYMDRVLVDADTITEYINIELMPLFYPKGDAVFMFDKSPWDTTTEGDKLEAEVVNSQLNGGYISLGFAANIQERPVEPWMENRYIVDGVPMTPEQIDRLVEAKIAQNEMAATPFGGGLIEFDEEEEEEAQRPTLRRPQIGASDKTSHSEKCECGCNTGVLPYDALYKNADGLYPPEHVIDARIWEEVETFKKWAKNGWSTKRSRPFESDILPPYLRFALMDAIEDCPERGMIPELVNGVIQSEDMKTLRTYQAGLRQLVTGLWREEITPGHFVHGMNNLIQRQFEDAFERGVKRGGLTMADMDTSEVQERDQLMEREKSYIPDLMQFVRDNARRLGGKLRTVRARVDRWTARYLRVQELGYLFALRGKKVEWRFNPALENCTDCSNLNGKVYRATTWRKIGITPQSPDLACFGIHCGCRFIRTTKPLSRGRPPLIVGRG
jgi:hypothetical protein